MNAFSKVHLRPLKSGDARTLSELHHLGFPKGWSSEECESMLMRPEYRGFMAVIPDADGGWCAGFVLMRQVMDEVEIIALVTHPKLRRHGIANQLMEAVMESLHHDMSVFLEVRAANDAAIALYQKQGFQAMGRRADYYTDWDGQKVDAVTMRCNRKG